MQIFTDRLTKIMKETETSGYKLAKAIGADNQTVLNWLQGKNEPKISYLQKIALYFDCSADYLLGLSDI